MTTPFHTGHLELTFLLSLGSALVPFSQAKTAKKSILSEIVTTFSAIEKKLHGTLISFFQD
jgi:hypothetical protein